MIYRGRVKGGVIVLDDPAGLPEGMAVSVEPVGPHPDPALPDRVAEDADNPLLRMLDLAGPTGIPDLATNIDHYLYGHPKVDDEG